jgi:uncharacterized protein with GYD domain
MIRNHCDGDRKENITATYISLLSWTDKGVSAIHDTVSRRRQAEEALGRMGVQMKQAFWTQGRCDVVLILEAPDDATVAAATLGAARQGFFRTETMRAFTEAEMEQIIQKIG